DSGREAGLARPMVDEEYAANLMRAVSMDAAAAIRGDRARTRYYVDQATRVYLALIGYTGGLAALDGDRDSADPARVRGQEPAICCARRIGRERGLTRSALRPRAP